MQKEDAKAKFKMLSVYLDDYDLLSPIDEQGHRLRNDKIREFLGDLEDKEFDDFVLHNMDADTDILLNLTYRYLDHYGATFVYNFETNDDFQFYFEMKKEFAYDWPKMRESIEALSHYHPFYLEYGDEQLLFTYDDNNFYKIRQSSRSRDGYLNFPSDCRTFMSAHINEVLHDVKKYIRSYYNLD